MTQRLVLKFKKLHPDAVIPTYAHDTDAAFDIYTIEKKSLKPQKRHVFKTGLASEIPDGWWVSIRDRSSLPAKFGLHTMAGVIDAGYRGEWGVVMVNLGEEEYKVEKGDKIAQGILEKVNRAKIIEVNELLETERGEGGFGSTGRK